MPSPSTVAAVAVLAGVALRVWAYAADTSLWLDEILLARNIIGLPLRQLLTEPLQLDQVAPRGFLLVEKLAVLALGPGEHALRLVPFLCGIAGLLLFHRLASHTLDGWAVPLATTLWAIGIPFLRYGTEVKQYHLDVTATVVLLLVALDLQRREATARRLAGAAVAGLIVPWFSQASVVVMAGLGLAVLLAWLRWRDGSDRRVLLGVMPVWAASALIAVLVGRASMTPSTQAFMNDFWHGGFVPLPAGPLAGLAWLRDQLLSAFGDPGLLRYPLPGHFLAIAAVGILRLWRNRPEVALLVLGPLLVAIGAAVAQQYPFRGRLMFYLLPVFLLALGAGAETIRRLGTRLHPAVGSVLMAALLVPPTLALAQVPPPYDHEHHRVLLTHLQRHRRPGDAVYSMPLTRIGLLYYGPQYGLRPGEWATAVCDREDTRAFLRDVDRYRGRPRVWLFSSAARPYRTARPAVREYLATIGVKRDSLTLASLQFNAASLELYDLSDPTRLRNANAESFPVQPMPTDPRPGCRPWIRPSPADSYP